MSYGRAAFAAQRMRQDNWQSTLGGLGGSNDRGRTDRIQLVDAVILDDYTLSAAFRNLWLTRRVICDPIDDAFRDGWGTEDELPEFDRLNTSVHDEGAFQRACTLARLKGGAGVYLGYRHGGGPESLLAPAPPGAKLEFLEVFDRFQLQGSVWNHDVDAANYDRPEVWTVIGERRTGLRFHESRLIRFPGVPRATERGLTKDDRVWGDSALQACWSDVIRYGVFWQVISHLLHLKSVGVLKLKGLIQMLASNTVENAEARIDLLNEAMGLTRLMLLDAEHGEEYTREDVAFTDMPALLQELQLATAGAVGEPVTKLFGRAPAGMNATGESDSENWYAKVEAYRKSVQPRLERLIEVCEGRAVELEFKPLWQLTELEEAQVRAAELQGDETLWRIEAADAAEIRKARHEGKRPEDVMSGAPPEPAPQPAPVIAPVGAPPEDEPQATE